MHSTTGPERPSAGRPPPKSSNSNYARSNNPVLQGLVELPQYTSLRLTEHLALEEIRPSIGTVGDSYDTPSKMMLVGVGSHAWPKLRLAVRRPDPALRLAASPANALICRPRRNLPCWNGSMVRRRRVTGSPTAAVPTITRRAVPLDVVVAAAED